jgi:hypothetical protein
MALKGWEEEKKMGDHVKNGASLGLLAGWIIDRHILDAHNASFPFFFLNSTYTHIETTVYKTVKKKLDKNNVATLHLVYPFLPQERQHYQDDINISNRAATHLFINSAPFQSNQGWRLDHTNTSKSMTIEDYCGLQYSTTVAVELFRQ